MRNIRYCAVLVLAMVSTVTAWSTDVNSASALRDALGNATVNGNVVTLTSDVSLGSTLTITEGTMVLDMAGKKIKYDRTGTSGNALAILVNGANASVIIKNGTIEVLAAKGAARKNGYSAICIQLKAGSVSLSNQILIAKPGEGGDKFIGKADPGSAYTIDPDVGNVDDMIAKGAYVEGASANDYASEGYPGTSTSSAVTTTVSLVKYNVSYTINGGTPQPSQSSYTIETSNFQFPTVTKNGYTLANWTCNGSPVDINNLPTTTKREATDNVTFVANWTLTLYKVIYNTDGGSALSNGSYTIEQDLSTLPTPTKDGYEFDGWHREGKLVTSVPKGTGDVTLTAQWLKQYKITYNKVGGETTETLKTGYTAKTETFTLPLLSKEGYVFKGWFDDKNTEIKTIVKGSSGDVNLTARWDALQYTLRFQSNCNETIGDITYSKDKVVGALSDLTGKKPGYTFKGWYDNESCSGVAITVSSIPYPADNTKPTLLYAKWEAQKNTITFETNGGSTLKNIEYTFDKETVLPVKTSKNAYTFAGWYDSKTFEGDPLTSIKAFSRYNDFTLYAKWNPIEYPITFDPYYGSFPSGTIKPEKYTIESEDIVLPMPVRNGFTFVGWYDNDLLTGEVKTSILKGSFGAKSYFAKWTTGSIVSFVQPANGSLSVKNGDVEIKNGDKIGVGTKLSIKAVPASGYSLSKLIIGGKQYTVSTKDTVMPTSGGLTISAEFVDPRPAVNVPKITVDPAVDFVPSGETVTISLQKTDDSSTLYYSVLGATEKLYTAPFPISTVTATESKIQIKAIARKSGYKDGISTREIVFRKGKYTIDFVLPKGVTAVNPEGGEVVSAVASGGTFEFMLEINKNYVESLDSLKVQVNDKTIEPDAFGIYTLSNTTGNVTVKVSGISSITHVVTLKQSANGYICFTGDDEDSAPRTVSHGDRVSVTAKGDAEYKFFSWTDGTTDNPRQVLVENDMTIQARFVKEDPGFLMVLPTLTGAKVKPLTGYATEVKKGGTFKFYISKESDYNESVPVVYANGETLTVYKDVYSIYNVTENMVIAVDGIQLNKATLKLADNVIAFNMETAVQITDEALTPTTMIYLLAKSPEGKRFSMWNDGKGDNPRIIAVKDAQQLLPLFVASSSEKTLKVDLPIVPGAGMGAVNANAEAVVSGSDVQLKLVVLPQYSKSQPIVKVDGKVLEPETSLRASSETKTLFYNLNKLATDVKVELSGLVLNDYTVALEQTAGGTVRASKSGQIKHGTVITLNATPSNGNLFLKWNDGNTMNPYTYTVTGDCVFSARFDNADIPLDNESIGMDGTRIYTEGNNLYVDSPKATGLKVWNFAGQVICSVAIPEGISTINLLNGEYIVKVGTGKPVKISIR